VVNVTVLEADTHLGGKVVAADVAGIVVDTGPDALMVRSPAAAQLVSELGLDDSLRPPSGAGAFLWSRGRLRPLPTGSVFGVPDKLVPLLRSGLLDPIGFVRAGADLVLPRREPAGDPTIEQLLRPRFGRQVYERLVEPLLGGVHAGRAGRLSARSAAAEVMALAAGHRSLYLALRERKRKAAPGPAPRPPLMSMVGGLPRLVGALADASLAASADLRTGARVRELRAQEGRYVLSGDGFEPFAADDVVLATPAWAAADLLRPLAPAAADALAGIEYVGVATVIMAYPRSAMPPGLRGTGFLVPPVEGRLLVGCTWLTEKWPHLADGSSGGPTGPDAPVLIRAMVGRDGDQRWADLDDDALVRAVRAELADAMGLRAEPLAVSIRRLPAAMPQYTVGHAERLAAVDVALQELPGVRVTGAGYRGVGLAGCITQADAAAAAVLERVTGAVGAR
jgi:oxygen-dependent protoporphyrinogen oxidase